MAILFYEGLPGAGKSYEAMVTQIIPFLQKGREVVAYIEGLNFDRIAEASGLPVDRVRELLFPLTREDMRPREVKDGAGKAKVIDGEWIEKTRENAFHVFDEAQNWWPNRLRATEQLTQFVTEHRHRGIDVLLMGQSLLDVLALWRRRVDQKFTFLKLTALGSAKRYRVTIFKGQGNDEFVKVTDKFGKYDPKFFGTYASHVACDTNTETYTDSRVNFARQWIFGSLPIVLGLLGWGGYTAWKFFHPPEVAKVVEARGVATPGPVAAAPQGGGSTTVDVKGDARSPQEKHLAELGTKGRIRLSGLLEGRGHIGGVVEWLDGNTRVIERLTLDQLRDLGVSVLVTGSVVRLTVGDWVQLATMWPVEAEGRVSEYRAEALRPAVGAVASSPGAGAGLTVIEAPARREPAAPIAKQPSANGFGSS